MRVKVDASKAKHSLNLFKQASNWDDIFAKAIKKIKPDIEHNVGYYLNESGIKKHTGRLAESISVSTEGSKLVVTSNHPAMGLIEYGGPSPFPNWNSATIQEYSRIYGKPAFVVARGIYRNQPFAEARQPIFKAVSEAMPDLRKETRRIAKEKAGK